MPAPLPSPADLRTALDKDGFVRIPHAFNEEELETFRTAAARATELARAGTWPYIRTLPKQFPPWTEDASAGIWGVQHLLHPDMPDRKVFAQSYFHPTMIEAITDLLDCSKDDLVLELYNMLVCPDRDFFLRWHRDDISPEVSPEEEEKRLKEPMLHAQWNLALYSDSSLVVVPGSHKRARTETERKAHPYEDNMPNQQIVHMSPGDVLFYNNNILHRGVYDSKVERMTLHGTMGVKGAGGEGKSRARNVLQHGIGSWAGKADFGSLGMDAELGTLAEGMRGRLLEMGGGEKVGFSQQG